jgi:hypothetical protein
VFLAFLAVMSVIAPLSNFPLISSDLGISTSHSPPVMPIAAGWELVLMMTVNNTLSQPLNVTYVTEAIDQNGYTDSIKSADMTIEGSQLTGLGLAWTPEHGGDYIVNGYVFTNMNKPELMAEPQNRTVAVQSQ